MTDPIQQPAVEIGPVPEVYVDAFEGVATANGVLKVNFISFVFDPATGSTQKRIVLRLVATAPNLMDMSQTLAKVLGDLVQMNGESGNA